MLLKSACFQCGIVCVVLDCSVQSVFSVIWSYSWQSFLCFHHLGYSSSPEQISPVQSTQQTQFTEPKCTGRFMIQCVNTIKMARLLFLSFLLSRCFRNFKDYCRVAEIQKIKFLSKNGFIANSHYFSIPVHLYRFSWLPKFKLKLLHCIWWY